MESFVLNLLRLVSFLFLARVIFSWIQLGPGSPFRPVADFVYRATEPVLAPIRRVIPPMGGFDISIIVVFLGISFVLRPLVAAIL